MAEAAIAVDTVQTVEDSNSDDGSVDNPSVVTDTESQADGDGAKAGDSTVDAKTGGTEKKTGNDSDQSLPPETYADFSLPEGVELDAALLDQATPLFKELNLTQEQAQKLIDFQSEQVQAGVQKQTDAFNQLKQDWHDQSKADTEIGGDKFDASVADARAALEKFGTPELTKLMTDFGVGNHPEMIRVFAKIGALTKEDVPGESRTATSKPKDHASILYPSTS